MRISVELVPRDAESLLRDARFLRENVPAVTMLNVPDLLRFSLRSWDACALMRDLFPAVPHLRAIDMAPEHPMPPFEVLQRENIGEVVAITGDPPDDMRHAAYPISSVDLIRRIKRELPSIKVYAALDPYRHSFRAERELVARKLEAGADGFFTQPMFDLRLVEIYGDMLAGQTVFWGISPIVSQASRAYWETRNSVVLPRDFAATPEWNRGIARSILGYAKASGFDAYLMPIRIDLARYLEGLFDGL